MEVLTLYHRPSRGTPPADRHFAMTPARSQYLLHLLAQVRTAQAGAAAGIRWRCCRRHRGGDRWSRSFAAIGSGPPTPDRRSWRFWARARGPAEESTFRRAFALVSARFADQVLGAWLWTRAGRSSGSR